MTPTLPPELLRVLAESDDEDFVRSLLSDILTPHEVKSIRERWEIVKRLDEGMSQRAIRDELGVSVTTISRGNRQLQYGSGGFRAALGLLKGEG
ncbi:MAG: TrpR family trp operon transcriptional repressor [Bradymonadia bacterium]|jgi:TrpR family trp operon transcriptional repressor